MKLKKGLVHIYTGPGKGKTTAALGLALRASGAGLAVYFLQFIKGKTYSELRALKKIRNVKIEQCGRGCFIYKNPAKTDIALAANGLKKARNALLSGKFDVVVLDEINVALHLGLVKTRDVIELINSRPGTVELVLTGRRSPKELYRYASLVTEMKELKHYYNDGVKARRGIEY